ncbi:peroxisomal copper amine oxidase [Marasmius fiardii PR-910]|nr:peroxisomal copper amine oxidase [Marasmius fiardii PR-910]
MSPTAIPDVPSTASAVQSKPLGKPASYQHPLDPLTPDEIAEISLVIRHYIAAETKVKAIKFVTCYLLPPPKRAVLAHLGISLTPGGSPEPAHPIVRKAEVDLLDAVSGEGYNTILVLKGDKWQVETFEQLPEGSQPQISPEELIEAENIVRENPRVQELARAVGVEPHQIRCDGWSIGYDDRFPQSTRIQQGLVFARFTEHDNLYAHPLDFIPVIDCISRKLLHIDFPPNYLTSPNGPVLSTKTTAPPSIEEDAQEASKRDRIPPPRKAFDFLPDLMEKTEEGFKLREGLKPLHVVQPEGVSFTVNGHELEWQNWKMHIAFSHREGVVLSTITYNDNGEVRPLIYRLSCAEMVVPYGAPEHPHPRKFAFDTGEYGMGTMANELSLGCDCVGSIHYLPGAYIGHNGKAVIIKNVICIHEEDNGVLWKHTDYRPGGRSKTVRRRRLVVSMVCTLANYEYIWNYHFYQDGSIEMEVRLTGILQIYVNKEGEPNPFGTNVAPGVNAHYHQHIFSYRIDPMIDGLYNSVVESDVLPLPEPTGSSANFLGNGFTTRETTLEAESGRDYDWQKERRWRIINPARKHYASGKAVGYGIGMKGGITPTMAKDDSPIMRRAGFVKYPFWVVKDVEGPKGGRMWPSGKFMPQTRDAPGDSITSWVAGRKSVKEEDLLVYLTIGTTHIPRPEDWPVMPVEHLNITLKPQSFFVKNPSMDVPSQHDLRSVPAFGQNADTNGSNTANGSNGSSCH